ncbi:MAG: universal stress protein [Acidobacteria bacterium]|nr:universal stress protein [Acidobacteriota bacterium]
MKIEDILVPTDFSPNSLRAFEYALSLIEPGGELYLLHVIDADFIARLSHEGFGEIDAAIDRMRHKAEAQLQEMVNEHKESGIHLESMVVVGKPFAEILRVADDLDFSMIVLGTRGQRGSTIDELLFGSTAEKILRATPIPVVCVPPNWATKG